MNQNRKHDIKVRMNDAEYEQLQNRMEEAGAKSLQRYGLDALLTTQITSKEQIDALVQANQKMAELNSIERGIGTNINQIARHVNTAKEADAETMKQILIELESNKQERERLWQSTRLLLTQLKHMEPCEK